MLVFSLAHLDFNQRGIRGRPLPAFATCYHFKFRITVPGCVVQACNPGVWEAKEEDCCKFKASRGYTVRLYFQNKQTNEVHIGLVLGLRGRGLGFGLPLSQVSLPCALGPLLNTIRAT